MRKELAIYLGTALLAVACGGIKATPTPSQSELDRLKSENATQQALVNRTPIPTEAGASPTPTLVQPQLTPTVREFSELKPVLIDVEKTPFSPGGDIDCDKAQFTMRADLKNLEVEEIHLTIIEGVTGESRSGVIDLQPYRAQYPQADISKTIGQIKSSFATEVKIDAYASGKNGRTIGEHETKRVEITCESSEKSIDGTF